MTGKFTVHSAVATDSMMREEHRHLLWAFGCITLKTRVTYWFCKLIIDKITYKYINCTFLREPVKNVLAEFVR